jgi:hypothetical protein
MEPVYEAAMSLTLALPTDDGNQPLHRRLYLALREAILDGRLGEGAALPSSRALAAQMGVARNTVLAAYDQLEAEGFTQGRQGSATRVAARQPLLGSAASGPSLPPPPSGAKVAAWSATPPMLMVRDPTRPFAPGVPDLAAFPHAEWRRVLGRLWRRPPVELMCGIDPLMRPCAGPSPSMWGGIGRCAATPTRSWWWAARSRPSIWWPACWWNRENRCWWKIPAMAGCRACCAPPEPRPRPFR